MLGLIRTGLQVTVFFEVKFSEPYILALLNFVQVFVDFE